jgi:hypothetical protein
MAASKSRIWKHCVLPTLAAFTLLPANAWADGPRYSFVGVSYAWTDSKFGVDPTGDENFNNGDFEGVNLDLSLGIVSFLHIAGQYFDGDCNGCGTGSSGNNIDLDYSGYKLGLGLNPSLDLIGLDESADFVIRANFVDVELDAIDDDGWSVEAHLVKRISERGEVNIGYEYQDVGDVKNRDVVLVLSYELFGGLAFTARGIVFDDDTGFDLGVRWYFGEALGGRDSLVR